MIKQLPIMSSGQSRAPCIFSIHRSYSIYWNYSVLWWDGFILRLCRISLLFQLGLENVHINPCVCLYSCAGLTYSVYSYNATIQYYMLLPSTLTSYTVCSTSKRDYIKVVSSCCGKNRGIADVLSVATLSMLVCRIKKFDLIVSYNKV